MIVTYTSGSGWPRQSMAREQAVRREGGYRWNRGSRPSTGTATAPPQCSIPSWRQGDVDRISKVGPSGGTWAGSSHLRRRLGGDWLSYISGVPETKAIGTV